MKAIAGLVAATALITGISVATAQTRPSERTPAGADSTQHTQGAPQPTAGPRPTNPTSMAPPATTGGATVAPGTPKPSEQRPLGADSTDRAAGSPQPMDNRMKQ